MHILFTGGDSNRSRINRAEWTLRIKLMTLHAQMNKRTCFTKGGANLPLFMGKYKMLWFSFIFVERFYLFTGCSVSEAQLRSLYVLVILFSETESEKC